MREKILLGLVVLCGWLGTALYIQQPLGNQDVDCVADGEVLQATVRKPYNDSWEAEIEAKNEAKRKARQELEQCLQNLSEKRIPADQIEKLLQGAKSIDNKTEIGFQGRKVAVVTLEARMTSSVPPVPSPSSKQPTDWLFRIFASIGAIGAPIVLLWLEHKQSEERQKEFRYSKVTWRIISLYILLTILDKVHDKWK